MVLENKEKTKVIFQCHCSSGHGCEERFELTHDQDDGPDVFWVNSFQIAPSFWQAVRWWWRERRSYYTSLILCRDDLIRLRNKVDEELHATENEFIQMKQ